MGFEPAPFVGSEFIQSRRPFVETYVFLDQVNVVLGDKKSVAALIFDDKMVFVVGGPKPGYAQIFADAVGVMHDVITGFDIHEIV